jgi:hypothetical protein
MFLRSELQELKNIFSMILNKKNSAADQTATKKSPLQKTEEGS